MAPSLRALAFWSALFAASCGGSVAVPGAEGGSGGGGLTTTSSTGATPCPASAPAEGAPCSGATMCSYGAGGCQQPFACIDGQWAAGDLACSTCPASTPALGELCAVEGQACEYTDPSCSAAGTEAVCKQGAWDVTSFGPACAPTCAPTPPVDGTPCSACCDDVCSYPAMPGCTPITASCVGGTWSVTPSTCAPPGPCLAYGNPMSCQADPTCRWLVPGCSDPALPYEGCFSKTDCQSDGECGPAQLCLKCEIDPCWASGCNACSMTAFVCVPPPPP